MCRLLLQAGIAQSSDGRRDERTRRRRRLKSGCGSSSEISNPLSLWNEYVLAGRGAGSHFQRVQQSCATQWEWVAVRQRKHLARALRYWMMVTLQSFCCLCETPANQQEKMNVEGWWWSWRCNLHLFLGVNLMLCETGNQSWQICYFQFSVRCSLAGLKGIIFSPRIAQFRLSQFNLSDETCVLVENCLRKGVRAFRGKKETDDVNWNRMHHPDACRKDVFAMKLRLLKDYFELEAVTWRDR